MNVMRAILLLFGAALLFSLCLLSCSKSMSGGGDDEDDGNTPYNILDVRVVAVTDSSVTLTWTATGDDADVGTASQYDLRYYHSWLNSTNWDSAVRVTGEPAPRPTGQADSMVVTGLQKDSTYYFALKAGDEAGNWNNVSNCAVAVCFMMRA